MDQNTIIVGAGVAGLRCAGELAAAGRDVRVLERAHSVGGRCATRSFEGQAVDFGPLFLHGRDPAFLEALGRVAAGEVLPRWPRKVEGTGSPCQPGALEPATDRLAFGQGVKALPRHLAEGLTIELETEVTSIRLVAGGFEVGTGQGGVRFCRDLVLALALEESRRLLGTLPTEGEVAGAQALLGLFASVPCLTVIAGYPLEVPEPPWDIQYPGGSELLQLLAQDSTKREALRFRTFVAQARPRWSRLHQDTPPEQWSALLLREAGALLGSWALRPLWVHPHRWRYARVDAASELSGPLRLTFPGGQRLGLAGDVFAPGGGVQAAWLSGTRLAERLLS